MEINASGTYRNTDRVMATALATKVEVNIFYHGGKTRAAKQEHYEPLVEELQLAGWEVHMEVHVLTVGARATVPKTNEEELEALGVNSKTERARIQREWVGVAADHMARIVKQFRRTVAKETRNSRHAQAGPT